MAAAQKLTHLPAEDVAAGADSHHVGVVCEDLLQHGADVLPFTTLGKVQLHNVLQRQGLPCHWVLPVLHDVWHDVGDVIGRAVKRAGLQVTLLSKGLLKVSHLYTMGSLQLCCT